MTEKQKNILHLITVFIIEVAYFSFIFFGYAIFSMLFFGEGESSFMYSKANGVVFLLLLVVPPLFLNIYFYSKSKNYGKRINFLIVQISLLFIFFFFWYMSGWDFYF